MIKVSKNTKKNISLLTLSQLLVMIFGFATNVIWTRYFEVEVFGAYQLIISFLSFVGVLAYSGLNQSLSISASKNFGGNLKKIILEKSKIAILLLTLLWGIAYYYYYKGNVDIAIIIVMSSILFPLYVNQTSWDSWANGRGAFAKYAFLKLISAMWLFSSVFISYYLSLGLFSIIAIIGINLIFHLSLTYYFYAKRDNDVVDLDTITYGKVLTGALFINGLLVLDKFLIENYLSLSDVAIFSVAMIFPNLLRTFFDISNKLFIPRFSKFNTILQVWNWFKIYFGYIMIFYTLCGIVGFFILEYVIVLFFSELYAEAGLYAKWLFLPMALAIPVAYFSQMMVYQNKIKFSYTFARVNVFIKVIGFFTLLPIFGLWGMVYTSWINLTINSIVILCYFNYYLKESILQEVNINNSKG